MADVFLRHNCHTSMEVQSTLNETLIQFLFDICRCRTLRGLRDKYDGTYIVLIENMYDFFTKNGLYTKVLPFFLVFAGCDFSLL